MARLGTKLKRAAGLAALFFIAATAPTAADFAAGAQAYDAGDVETAIEEWRAAAAAGDLDAIVALASLTEDGIGLAQDYKAAAALYRQAADRGDPVAQLNLGDYYSRGRGVERDLVQAYFWLSLSMAQGRKWPATRRAAITPLMSDAQIAEAEALLEERND